MKLTFFSFRNLRLAASLALGLSVGNTVWGAPSIQSTVVAPNPLVGGQGFTITVNASQDVTQGAATVDFRPAATVLLRVPLAKQGPAWIGTGVVPTNLKLPPGANASVKVQMFDASRQLVQSTINVGVSTESITAVFAGGVLTITGDDHDNTIIASRDAAGNILINNGAVLVTGGTPT